MDVAVEHPCPVCQAEGGLSMRSHIEEIPYFGEHTQVTLLCTECGWRQTDFIPADGAKPGAWALELRSPEHLTARVVRSSSCTVRIPELDLEVNPGTSASGYVSNVEGVIKRFEEVVMMVQRDALRDAQGGAQMSESLDACQSLLTRFNALRDGDFSQVISLVLLDPRGHSQILHADAIDRELEDDEIAVLPVGPDPAVFQA